MVKLENGTLHSVVLKDASEGQTSRTSSNDGNARGRHDCNLDEESLHVSKYLQRQAEMLGSEYQVR